MKVLIFGASGKVGSLVVDELLARGYSVRAFIHSSSMPERENLEFFKGDIHNRADVEAALQDVNVVISTLGSWGTKQKNIVSSWAEYAVPAMQSRGIKRVITLTGDFAIAPGDNKPSLAHRVAMAGFNFFLPKILRDGENHIAILASSTLDWTVLRSPVMRNGASTRYRLATKPGWGITRRAVAKALVDQVADTAWIKSAPYLLEYR